MERPQEQPISYDAWFRSLDESRQQEVIATLKKALEELGQMPTEAASQYGVDKDGLERLLVDLEKSQ